MTLREKQAIQAIERTFPTSAPVKLGHRVAKVVHHSVIWTKSGNLLPLLLIAFDHPKYDGEAVWVTADEIVPRGTS